MDAVYRCCCGLDVHKDRLAANLLRRGMESQEDLAEVRSFRVPPAAGQHPGSEPACGGGNRG